MNMVSPQQMTPGAPQVAEPEVVLFEGRPALVSSIGVLLLALVTVGIYLIVRYLHVIGTSYKVTSRRVVLETGVFSKKLEQVDLYRVTDYAVERPFGQRLVGTGNLVLITVDRTTSRVELKEIKADVVALYEQVRQATEADKLRRGVRMVDYE